MSNIEVGKAYRGPDGIVRWVTHLSKRGYYRLLWLEEERNVWYYGGVVKAEDWLGGEEVQAPRVGDSYTLIGPTGVPSTRTA